ncbi:MAG: right-handed parallel beta-helix repeat-containing protein [Rhodospirillaceae bacterium]
MKRHLGIFPAAAALAVLLFSGVASGEMRVKLKDGRVLTLPVEEADVEGIAYGSGTANGSADSPVRLQPVQRVADRMREDEERVHSAREAEQRASQAAKAAEEAAAQAKASAETARREAEAARVAREAAEKSARIPPQAGAAAPAPVVVRPGAEPPPAIAKRPDARAPEILRVGPGEKYGLPSEAARAARDGDVIEIAAGTYAGDVVQWNASGLTIRGVGGRPHMDAQGRSLGGKAIWVIRGNDTVVENIEFSNCRVPDRNGAGIRLEGRNLTVRNSYFHDNEMGLLTGHDAQSDVVIEGSEFARNVVDYKTTGRLGHNIYIGQVRSFTLRNSYSHGARWGHNVKSRARENRILYSRLIDGNDGGSSYLVDIAEGGSAWLVGNLIEQGPDADNWAMVSFGAEKRGEGDRIALVNNTAVNNRSSGVFLQNRSAGEALLLNNILAGRLTPASGSAQLRANLIAKNVAPGPVGSLIGGSVRDGSGELAGNYLADAAGFADPASFDVRLTETSPARDRGAEPGMIFGWPVRPDSQYVHPLGSEARPNDARIDIGAYEFMK